MRRPRAAEAEAGRVAVVIPTLERGNDGLLGDALAAVAAQRGVDRPDVVVVRDGAGKDAALIASAPGARCLATRDRGGFAAAANRGIDAALEAGADYVFLLNDDTLLREDTLARLLAAATAHPEHGLFSPKILFPGEPKRVWWAGGAYSPGLGVPRHFGYGRRDGARYSATRTISFATGCALLVRRAVFERVGRLSADFFAYGEDVDFSLRARRAGHSILFVPDAVLVHRVEADGRRRAGEPWRLRLATANLLRLVSRYAGGMQRVTAVAWFSLRWVAYLALRSICRGDGASLRAVLGGVGDFRRSPHRASPEPAT